eukprot:1159753-Pelagomonas_calceolata.AAC.8
MKQVHVMFQHWQHGPATCRRWADQELLSLVLRRISGWGTLQKSLLLHQGRGRLHDGPEPVIFVGLSQHLHGTLQRHGVWNYKTATWKPSRPKQQQQQQQQQQQLFQLGRMLDLNSAWLDILHAINLDLASHQMIGVCSDLQKRH